MHIFDGYLYHTIFMLFKHLVSQIILICEIQGGQLILLDTPCGSRVCVGIFYLENLYFDVGLLSRALLTGNLNLAVELCLEQNRLADALVLAMQGGPELLQDTQIK